MRHVLRRQSFLQYGLATIALLLLSGASAMATSFPLCPTDTLANYETSFATATSGCQIGDLEVYGFVDSLSASGGASTAGVSIRVVPTGSFLDFALTGFSVSGSESLDLKVGFDVATTGATDLISGATGILLGNSMVAAGGSIPGPIAGLRRWALFKPGRRYWLSGGR